MSNANKKRGGIGGFWDNFGPEQPSPRPDETAPTARQPGTIKRDTSARPRRQATTTQPQVEPQPVPEPSITTPVPQQRGRGRPRNDEPKARTTVNMSPKSWRLLEALRYRARMQGQRSTTYANLLDKAIALLAEERGITLDDE